MLVQIHVFLLFFFGYFSSEVFHYGTWFVIWSHLHDRPELTTRYFFSGKWWSHSDDDFEILISRWATAWAKSSVVWWNERLIHLRTSMMAVLITWHFGAVHLLVMVILSGKLLLTHVDTQIHIHFLFLNDFWNYILIGTKKFKLKTIFKIGIYLTE